MEALRRYGWVPLPKRSARCEWVIPDQLLQRKRCDHRQRYNLQYHTPAYVRGFRMIWQGDKNKWVELKWFTYRPDDQRSCARGRHNIKPHQRKR